MQSKIKRLTAGLMLSAGLALVWSQGPAGADGEARTIALYHIHTKETLTILYKKNGKYIPGALTAINKIMRDWRENEIIEIDPKAIDIAWEMHNELGSREPIHIICGYRSEGTNKMLRRTRGGQASQSQHLTGKAIDIAFPDVPVRRLRYSAMIRERGGVGYYPTSAIPFVHVDTARVRHWPRMLRDELALLFPSGRTKYEPADGRSITPEDARRAKSKNPDLAMQVAQYFDLRANPVKTTLIASAEPAIVPPAPKLAERPRQIARQIERLPEIEREIEPQLASLDADRPTKQQDRLPEVASLEPVAARQPVVNPAPKLVASPRLVERASKFSPLPSNTDKIKLDQLVTLASLAPDVKPAPVLAPVEAKTAPAKPKGLALASLSALGGPAKTPSAPSLTAAPQPDPAKSEAIPASEPVENASLKAAALLQGRFDGGTSWIAAPAYDDDHPEDLAYQPFPIGPMVTETASIDDPAMTTLVHPNAAKTFAMLDDDGRILPMRLRPGLQTAQLLWAQKFSGNVVHLDEIERADDAVVAAPQGFAERQVKTTAR